MKQGTTPEPVQEIEQETTPADYSDNNAMDTSITAKRPQ